MQVQSQSSPGLPKAFNHSALKRTTFKRCSMRIEASETNGANGSSPNNSNGTKSNGNRRAAFDKDKSKRDGLNWAKMSLHELDKHSLMEEMEAARAQQDFAKGPNHTPKVQNKARTYALRRCSYHYSDTFQTLCLPVLGSKY